MLGLYRSKVREEMDDMKMHAALALFSGDFHIMNHKVDSAGMRGWK